jgi:hypothetical protein
VKITRFEDIEAWKEARGLVSRVYESTGKEPFKNDWGLKDQIQRAAVSVMSNIAEGFMSQTYPLKNLWIFELIMQNLKCKVQKSKFNRLRL